jgi:hypothetical protein
MPRTWVALLAAWAFAVLGNSPSYGGLVIDGPTNNQVINVPEGDQGKTMDFKLLNNSFTTDVKITAISAVTITHFAGDVTDKVTKATVSSRDCRVGDTVLKGFGSSCLFVISFETDKLGPDENQDIGQYKLVFTVTGDDGSIATATAVARVADPGVPEPSTLVLAGMGALVLAGYCWRHGPVRVHS